MNDPNKKIKIKKDRIIPKFQHEKLTANLRLYSSKYAETGFPQLIHRIGII